MNPTTELVTLCRNLSRLREAHNLTKTQMAKILGIGMNSLALIEKGVCPPTLGVNDLLRVCRHFRLPIRDLFSPFER